MRYENLTIDSKNIDYRYFYYCFALTKHHKDIKNYPEWASNINPFFSLYNWPNLECLISINNNNNYTIFEKKINPKTALIVFYVDATVLI